MTERFIDPTQEAGVALFTRGITGPVVMLNLMRFRKVADYSAAPELAPAQPISGRAAYQKYLEFTEPFLQESGGELLFLGEGGPFFIGPQNERWDVMMLVKQNSLADFMAFASNPNYQAGIGHRTAALEDSRLLPLVEFAGMDITNWP